MKIDLPCIHYNEELYQYIKNTKKCDLENIVKLSELIGEGAIGTAYSADIKYNDSTYSIIVKEHSRNKYCQNEYEALAFLRDKLVKKELLSVSGL